MPEQATIAEVTHHTAQLGGGSLHYVRAGSTGTPIVLVHGFPESWWAFHKLIPLLARSHQVIAVDLPGFGDSSVDTSVHGSFAIAETLGALIRHLDVGPVHLTGQDVGGPATLLLAAGHPDLVRSYTGIETALPGYGWEMFADVAKGGVWHVGFLAAPGIPDMLLTGRERQFLGDYAFALMNGTKGAISEADLAEFVRVYSRDGGWRAANALYGSLLTEGPQIRAVVEKGKLAMPVLAVDGGSGPFTSGTLAQVANSVTTATVEGVGHLVAMEAPGALAEALLNFYRRLDAA
jgi:pimeloyl-ACP methyl ester carboxylesterase